MKNKQKVVIHHLQRWDNKGQKNEQKTLLHLEKRCFSK